MRVSRRRGVLAAIAVALAGGLVLGADPADPVVFTHGIASGDLSATSAILWTHVDRKARLRAEVSPSADFASLAFTTEAAATAAHGFTVKVVARGLEPEHRYYYRFRHDAALSDVGTFRTAPLPTVSRDGRFAFSGDTDATLVDGHPVFNEFEVLDAVRADAPDVFLYIGDTIYADSRYREDGPATSLREFREAYQTNRDLPALRELLRTTPIYAIWDDHEVRDDFDAETVDPTLFARGRRAFLEYWPMPEPAARPDPDCAASPMFRFVHWSRDVDLFMLDERSCRSAEAESHCLLENGTADPVPLLPAGLRRPFGLPDAPPPGCLDALLDPRRTMLGARQKRALEQALLLSSARFKLVVNQVPIQQYFAFPYDRWEGYAAERRELLEFMRDRRIDNVVFLTTDNHANLINDVFIDRFEAPRSLAVEFTTGPIATHTLKTLIERESGPELAPRVLATFNAALAIAGVECHNLDAYSYGLLEVDAAAGTAKVTLKRDDGSPLFDQRQTDKACMRTLP
jgi:alkaline phosphatase D